MDRNKLCLITRQALRDLAPETIEILSFDAEEGYVHARIISKSFEDISSKVKRFEMLSQLTTDDSEASKFTYAFEAWTPAEYESIFRDEQNDDNASDSSQGRKIAARSAEV